MLSNDTGRVSPEAVLKIATWGGGLAPPSLEGTGLELLQQFQHGLLHLVGLLQGGDTGLFQDALL